MKQLLYDSVIEQAHEGAKIRVNFKKAYTFYKW